MITPKEQRLLDRLHGIGRDLAKFNADLAEHFANDGGGALAAKLLTVLDSATGVDGNEVAPVPVDDGDGDVQQYDNFFHQY